MGRLRAIEIAKWFIKKGLDSPRDTYDGNMKLQKLLYFSQLIHMAKFGKLLFPEEMRAYKNGTVVNDVRLVYRDEHFHLIEQAKNSVDLFDDQEINETLQLTTEIFGDMTARELSALNHELVSWNVPHNASKTNIENFYLTGKSVINPDDGLFMHDVNKVKDMLAAYEENQQSTDFEVVNGVTYYYNPDEVVITEEILTTLQEMECPDIAYTLTYDEEQGLIIL